MAALSGRPSGSKPSSSGIAAAVFTIGLHSRRWELRRLAKAGNGQFGQSAEFAEAWSAYLAREVQDARLRSEILSLKTVAERLDAWLLSHGECMPVKGEWKSLAHEIGVSPEALYRELGRRRV